MISSKRADKKLIYSQLMIDELISYDQHHSNDDWEYAHQEAALYHLSGTMDAFLHEINIAYKLNIALSKVDFRTVKQRLCSTEQSSPAFIKLSELRGETDSWLSLLYEMRNHGTHRARVGKLIKVSVGGSTTPIANEFKDPRTGKPQTVYPGFDCENLLFQFKSDVENLISECRRIDPKLNHDNG